MDIFAPRRSRGWVWSLVLALFIVATLVVTVVAAATDPEEEMPLFIWILVLAIDIPLFVLFAAITVCFPLMRYRFEQFDLVLTYGPLLTYRIPYADVLDIRQQDLSAQAWSSMRWPGLALWKVPYGKDGVIQMCSTRVNRGVTLIETTTGRYGISPEEEERFTDTLRSRAHLFLTHA